MILKTCIIYFTKYKSSVTLSYNNKVIYTCVDVNIFFIVEEKTRVSIFVHFAVAIDRQDRGMCWPSHISKDNQRPMVSSKKLDSVVDNWQFISRSLGLYRSFILTADHFYANKVALITYHENYCKSPLLQGHSTSK